jgi:HEAT repeat protein
LGAREAVSALRKLLTERRELPDREISACRTAHRRDAWFRWLLTEPPTGWPRAEVEAPLTLGIIAARSLGRLGPEADAAAERVAAMLSAYPPRREKHVRLAGESLLIAAMVGFREASLLPAWRMAKSPEVRVRRRGVEVLSGLAGEGIDDGAARALAFALLDPDPEVRSAAAEGIGRLGERVPRDLPWLWRRLGSPTIRRIGPPAAAAVLRLIKELASDDEATRRHAAWALSAIGPAAAAAAIDLVRVMDKDEHLAGNGALAAFAALGPAVGAEATTGLRCRVLAGADDADDLVSQRSAAVALLAVAPDDPAAPTARRIIRRALLRERSGIEWALSRLGTRGAEFAPDIAAGLRTAPTAAVFGFRESPLAQRCRALGAMGPDAASVLPELRRAVAALPPDLEPEHRRDAVLALWRIGRSAEECVPPLADLMARPQSIDVFHRSTNYADLVGLLQPVADALAETGHPAAAAALAERLSDRDPALRLLAARSLLRFAPSPEAAAAALPALLERLGDPDVRVRRAALSASMRLVGGPNCER